MAESFRREELGGKRCLSHVVSLRKQPPQLPPSPKLLRRLRFVRGVSSSLELLSLPRQLIDAPSVLKLEVLVVSQPQLGRSGGFSEGDSVLEMGCPLAPLALLAARWFPNWA